MKRIDWGGWFALGFFFGIVPVIFICGLAAIATPFIRWAFGH